MAKVKISVTQQDIDDAPRDGWQFAHPSYGPVNNAICRILGLRKPDVQIDGRTCENKMSWFDGATFKLVVLPDWVMENVRKFDEGEEIKPFEFEINF